MKRAISLFGALAVAAGFFLAAPTASAANPGPGTKGTLNVTCSEYSNGSSYPGPHDFLVCAPITTQSKSGRFGVISSMQSNVKAKLSTYQVRYYLFNNVDEYKSYFTGAGVTPGNPTSPYGFSSINGGGDSHLSVSTQH